MYAPAISSPTVERSNRSLAWAVGVILVIWFGVAVFASASGSLIAPVGRPPLVLLTAVLLPIVLAVAVYALSSRVRDFVRAGDPGLLTTLQSWRVVGGIFLVLLALGLMPAAFALPAGIGDVAIGLTAPFVARALAERGPERAGWLFVVWQWLGILDLVVAVGTGAATRTLEVGAAGEQMLVMSRLPLSLIPAFGVPLFVILHLASLAQYRARLRAGDERTREELLAG